MTTTETIRLTGRQEFERTILAIEATMAGQTEATIIEATRCLIFEQWRAWGSMGAWKGIAEGACERLLTAECELYEARAKATELEERAELLETEAAAAQAKCEAATTATARTGWGAIASNRRGQAAYARRAAESYRTGRMATYATRVRQSTERRAARLAA
jgi:hypothetical protein